MRPLQLARIAAEAEGLRWRSIAVRLVTRLVYAIIALMFIIGVVVFAHIALWYWLRLDLNFNVFYTALALGGLDLLIAVVLLVMASRSGSKRAEQEAMEVRRRAIAGMAGTLSLAQMVIPVVRMATRSRRRRR